MAWNEPGGGGNRDPWSGGGGGNQGPPDLDELLRKARDRINRLFGGRGGSGGGGGGGSGGAPSLSTTGILALAGIAVVAWLLTGIYIVDQGQRGVVTRFGKHVATSAPGPHWHWPYPIGEVQKVNVSVRRSVGVGTPDEASSARARFDESIMLTADENLVSVNMEVQYRVVDAAAYLFRFSEPDKTLRDIAISALREVVGQRNLGDLLAEDDLDVTFDQLGQEVELSEEQIESLREQSSVMAQQQRQREAEGAPQEDLVGAIRDLIVGHVETYGVGLEVVEVNVRRTRPPEAVQDAFDDAVRAREDMRRLIQEAIAYKNQQVPQARGRAARITADANSYAAETTNAAEGAAQRFTRVVDEYRQAPEVTRDRLYLETMQAVLTQSGKILVDTEGGNQPLMYMPLERMLRRGDVRGGGEIGGGTQAGSGYEGGADTESRSSSSGSSSSRSRTRGTR